MTRKITHCSIFLNFKFSDFARQNNLAKTSNCIFLSRKGDFSEFPHSPNFSVVLEVFVRKCAMTSTLILGVGEEGDSMLEGRRIFRIVLTPAGFPNFCHYFCHYFCPLFLSSIVE